MLQPIMNESPKVLRLEIRGLNHISSFKNSKVLITKNSFTGQPLEKPLLVTKGEYKKQMAKIVEAFLSQLLCAYQTAKEETGTALSRQYWIALSLPEDDSLNFVPEIHLHLERVPEGEEGALIEIEKL